MTVTGRGRGGDSVLSSFRHPSAGSDGDVVKGIGTGDVVATQPLRLSALGEMLQWWLPCV